MLELAAYLHMPQDKYNHQGAAVRYLNVWMMLALVLWPQVPRAQPPPPLAPAALDSHAQAATELLTVMNLERQMAGGAEAMVDVMIGQNAMLAPYRDVLLKWAASFMNWENFGPQVVALYEDAFTEQELRDMTAFYKSPTGQKSLTGIPQLTHRMSELGSKVAKEHVPELEAMIRARSAEIQKLTAKPSP
jgi:uncharacterized protein